MTMQMLEPMPEAVAANGPTVIEERALTALRVAEDLMAQRPDWVTFFRLVLGCEGVVPRLFPTPAARSAFEHTDAGAAIRGMLADLRQRASWGEKGRETTRVITVRLPSSLHGSLLDEAHNRATSLNQLCVSKLLLALA
jgi:hypothetical protein